MVDSGCCKPEMSGKIKRLFFIITFFVLIAGMALSGCASPAVTQSLIKINFTADGKTQTFSMPAGASVQQVLTQAGITLGNLDRTTPPAYTILTDGATVKLIRVKENFDVTDVIIPFEHQVVKNESLTSGQTLLIQPGVNGTQEITYRTVLEDGVEVSKTEFKSVIVKEAVPEISMVGIQAPFSPVPITGKLAYLIAGNAWVMQDTTGNRRPIVTSADLDGDIFTLSADGAWLLYSRKAGKDGKDNINTLWVINVDDATAKPIDLRVKNIKNYAGWVPGQGLTVAYSTVEPRPTAPGWQANNDLQLLTFKANGSVAAPKEVIATNSGGLYGWWGATFAWSPDGSKLAYARPDGVGLINLTNGAFLPKMPLTPLQTHSDWAWVPGLTWGNEGKTLYTVIHPEGSNAGSAENSPVFNLLALPLTGGPALTLIQRSGMFAYPVAAPGDPPAGYPIALLQAIFPDQSDTSHYRLVIMDQDGSNKKTVFPADGASGIEPQTVVWSPAKSSTRFIAVKYQGNIWMIDETGGDIHQITGDGLTTRIDWK
jgi:hypothetical protein